MKNESLAIEVVAAPTVERESAPHAKNEGVPPRGQRRTVIPDAVESPVMQGVIGQEKAVAFLERELRCIAAGQPLPFLGLFDDTGLGKTHLVTSFLNALPDGIKHFSLNCKDKLNLTDKQGKDYMDAISQALAENVPTIIHLDEFGNKNGNGSLQQWIMSHISKCPDGKALAIHGGDPLPFNAHNLGFIVSSFAPGKAAVDIMDRIKQPAELELTNYSASELADILKLAIGKTLKRAGLHAPKMSLASLSYISRSMRGNARQANDVAEEIRRCVADSPGFSLTLESAEKVMKTVGIYPHGLNQSEVKFLSCLSSGAKSRDTLQQKTGVEKAQWSRAINYLQDGTGRGVPFQVCNADGEPIAEACGALVDYERGKYHLTLHGQKMMAILTKKGWLD